MRPLRRAIEHSDVAASRYIDRFQSQNPKIHSNSHGMAQSCYIRNAMISRGRIGIAISAALAFTFISFDLAHGQQPTRVPHVGFIISSGATGTPSPQWEAFRQGLQDLGYLDGKNIMIERRYAEGRLDRMTPFVKEFVQHKVDVIMGVNNVVIRAAKDATKTIPIVMISSVDPVDAGYVDSFAHPGGNITGLAWLNRDISSKRVELLKQVLPKMSRIGVLWDGNAPGPAIAFKEYTAAAQGFKLDLRSIEIKAPNPDLEWAMLAAKNARVEGLFVVANPLMGQYSKQVFELALKHRMPSMTEEARYVDAGGLMSYGAHLADLYRRAAGYVVEILKGAKPGDLAVKLPDKFELSVNLKTARQLDINIPQPVLIQADKIIK
jgi:putative ABC transport system substrate-binding protein